MYDGSKASAGGTVEPVRVEGERVENENQDDGSGPEKERVNRVVVGAGGGKDIELCDAHGDSGGWRGGDGGVDIMQDDEDEDEILEDNGWGNFEGGGGGPQGGGGGGATTVLSMLMSRIDWISLTGA